MASLTPTIGRKVWFWPSSDDEDGIESLDDTQACDATVIFVHPDGTVNLSVIDHVGDIFDKKKVPLKLPDDVPTDDDLDAGYATWMPFQVGQAKATEEKSVSA